MSIKVHVYKVSSMYEYDLDVEDDTAALIEALKRVKFEQLPGVKADCRYVAIAPGGGRRDIYGEAAKEASKHVRRRRLQPARTFPR